MAGYGWARRLLHRAGIDVVRYRGKRFPEKLVQELIREHDVTLFIDVGASTGQTGLALRAGGYRGRIVSFEPQTAAFRGLAATAEGDPDWECRRAAVGDVSSQTQLNLSANSWSSSLLPISDRHRAAAPESAYEAAESVDVVRLDDLRDDLVQAGDRVYLKLDVQGYEKQALAGATELLRDVVVVETEASLAELYGGQVLAGDLVSLMRARAFVPLHVFPEFRDPHTQELLQVNIWFVRAAG
jgi:FkbM family methyltransferase